MKTRETREPKPIVREIISFRRVFTKSNISTLKRLSGKLRKSGDDGSMLFPDGESAVVVSPCRVPCDIVTMNSKVMLTDVAKGDSLTVTLVYPDLEDIGKARVSVLSALGAAMLGQRIGSQVCCNTSHGLKHIKIERIIYQPEAMGLYTKYGPS